MSSHRLQSDGPLHRGGTEQTATLLISGVAVLGVLMLVLSSTAGPAVPAPPQAAPAAAMTSDLGL